MLWDDAQKLFNIKDGKSNILVLPDMNITTRENFLAHYGYDAFAALIHINPKTILALHARIHTLLKKVHNGDIEPDNIDIRQTMIEFHQIISAVNSAGVSINTNRPIHMLEMIAYEKQLYNIRGRNEKAAEILAANPDDPLESPVYKYMSDEDKEASASGKENCKIVPKAFAEPWINSDGVDMNQASHRTFDLLTSEFNPSGTSDSRMNSPIKDYVDKLVAVENYRHHTSEGSCRCIC